MLMTLTASIWGFNNERLGQRIQDRAVRMLQCRLMKMDEKLQMEDVLIKGETFDLKYVQEKLLCYLFMTSFCNTNIVSR